MSMHVRQQMVMTEIAQHGLAGLDLSGLLEKTVALVAHTLDVEYCKVLELLPDGNVLLLRAGVGWREGCVGQTTVGIGIDSQAGYTLLSSGPVIVEDLRTETRFSGPPLLHDHGVVSGMSVIIHGREHPFGVLGVHTTRRRIFTREEVYFLQTVAYTLALAIERKQAEAELEALNATIEQRVTEQSEFIQLLHEIVDVAANEASTAEEVLQFTLNQICACIGWPVGHVYLVEESKDKLASQDIWYLDNPDQFAIFREITAHSRFSAGEGLPGRVLVSRRPEWIVDVMKDPTLFREGILQDTGVKAAFALPVLIGTEVVAVLEFFAREPKEINEMLLEVMMSIGKQLGRIVERKRAEVVLRESEERFRLLMENVKDYAIFMLDPSGHIISWNAGAEHIKGYRTEEIIGKHFSCFYSGEDIEAGKPQHALAVAAAQGSFKDENWRVRKGGSRFWAHITITALKDKSGHLSGFAKVTRDITERKRAEEALQESKRFIQRIADTTPDIIYLYDLDEMRNIYVNQQVAAVLGYTPEEIQRSGSAFFPTVIHPDFVPLLESTRERFTTVKDDDIVEIEYQMKHATGAWRWLYSREIVFTRTSEGLPKLILGTAQDITERKRIDEALQENNRYLTELARTIQKQNKEIQETKQYLENLLENANDFIYTVDLQNRITYINRKFEELGYCREDLIGQPLEVLLRASEKDDCEMEIQDGQGQKIICIVSTSPIRDHTDQIVGTLGIARDITQSRELEQQLRRSERLAYIGELTGGLAHEIKNPLSSLSTAASLLVDDAGTVIGEEQVTLLQVVQREAKQLNRILTDFLHFANPGQLNLESCNINVLCAQTLDALQYDKAATGKEIRKIFDPRLPPLQMDANQIKQVLWNIILNGLQAMEVGGTLTVSSTQRDPNTVLLIIQDTGHGIPREEQEKIFEPFYSRKKGGAGLGLAIVRRIMEAHGGRITVDSEEHKGTTFTLAFPV